MSRNYGEARPKFRLGYLGYSIDLKLFLPFVWQQAFLHLASRLIFKFYPMQGTVKFFNDDKGYGFITPDDGSKDVFVHIKAVTGDIADGSSVSFDVKEGPKGLNAVNVQVL